MMTNKELKSIKYITEDNMQTTIVQFEDNSTVYIFLQCGMIFVADYDYKELTKRIDADDTDSFESYDTIDNAAYFLRSEYAEYICMSLERLLNRFL